MRRSRRKHLLELREETEHLDSALDKAATHLGMIVSHLVFMSSAFHLHPPVPSGEVRRVIRRHTMIDWIAVRLAVVTEFIPGEVAIESPGGADLWDSTVRLWESLPKARSDDQALSALHLTYLAFASLLRALKPDAPEASDFYAGSEDLVQNLAHPLPVPCPSADNVSALLQNVEELLRVWK